jgi:hypothetical protein
MSTKQVATRDQIIKGLTDMCDPNPFFKTVEEFYGREIESDGQIWTGGEGDPSIDGIGIFDYYEGNNPDVEKYLEDNGWFAEWYDAGTMHITKI